eukprot:153648_1
MDRLERYHHERCSILVNGHMRHVNSDNTYGFNIPIDIIQLIIIFYPVYLSTNVYSIGLNRYGEFGMNNTLQYHKLTLCDWSTECEINHIYRGVITLIFQTIKNGFYLTGSREQYNKPTAIKHFISDDILKICCGSFGADMLWITKTGKLFKQDTRRMQNEPASPILVDYFTTNHLKVVDAASSAFFCLAVCDNGNVYSYVCGSTFNLIDAACGLEKDINSVCTWRKIDIYESIISVVAGSKHSLFVSSNGNVYSCGKNQRGQLGNSSVGNECILPRKIVYFEKHNIQIVKVGCGHTFNIALDNNGKVYTWGFGRFGQSGNGHINDTHEPQMIESLKHEIVVDIECGAGYLCAVTVNGDCFMWGKNDVFQCCNGNKENVLRPVKISKYLPKNKMIKQIRLGYYSTTMILCDI